MLQAIRTDGERKIFWIIHQHRGISRTELAQLSGLTTSAVTQIVKRLIAQDLVTEGREQPTPGSGRNRIDLLIAGHAYRLLGVVLRRDDVLWALCKFDGSVIRTGEIRLQADRGFAAVESMIDRVREEVAADRAELLAVGLGLPRFSMPWIHSEQFARLFSSRLAAPCYTHHNATYAALGEMWHSRRDPGDAFLYVFLGGGIGGALVQERSIAELPEIHSMEVGHVGIDSEGEPCICGNRGCMEIVSSPLGILRAAGVGSLADLRPRLTADAGLIRRATERLAYGLTSIVNILDVPRIVLGGYEENILIELYGNLQEMMARRMGAREHPATVAMAQSGRYVSAVGAALGSVYGMGNRLS